MADYGKEIFDLAGPSFLTRVDWSNPHHRRSIAASLVRGVSIMERDRQKNRKGRYALAPRWWEFFNFKLRHRMVDPHDRSYFGAIYEFNSQHPYHHCSGKWPPQYVIAFRGTMKKAGTIIQDLKLDISCITNDLENRKRFQKGYESAQELINKARTRNVWLAGYSLGSSISLLIGRKMVKEMKIHLETYLFNPPFISLPIEHITYDKTELALRFTKSVLTAGLVAAFKGGQSSISQETDPFVMLSSWIPNLFLNPSDPICSGFERYFEHREKMKSIGAGKIEKLATKHSMRSIFSSIWGKDSEAVHLIPHAYLTINSRPSKDCKEAHGIDQWWMPHLEFKDKLYRVLENQNKKEACAAMAASEREIFGLTGPSYLTAVDWNNSHHRRSIAASLVQGVYTMERDRQQNRQGPRALAPPWWQFFNFKLHHVMVDAHDLSYFGAIYEFNSQYPCHHYLGLRPPWYVIAFRGTIKKASNRKQDFKLNLHCIINNLENSMRFQIGYELARELIYKAGPGSVWLAEHSLGSSISLLIGRKMIKEMKIHLETYLFNPPFISPPIERITNDKIKLGLRFANSVLTSGLSTAVSGGQSSKYKENDPFIMLSSWIPYLFLNPSDPICSEYEGYFEHREKMESIGAGKIGKLATKHSIGSIFSSIRGKDCEAVHLIPCAYLTINSSPSQSFKEAHGIHQWWRRDQEFKYKLYQYKF